MKVFVCAIAVVLACCLLGIIFIILAKHGKRSGRLKDTYKNLSWLFFYIAIGVTIGAASVYFMLIPLGSLK